MYLHATIFCICASLCAVLAWASCWMYAVPLWEEVTAVMVYNVTTAGHLILQRITHLAKALVSRTSAQVVAGSGQALEHNQEEEQQPETVQHLVFVYDQAVKLLITATMELFQLHPLTDVDMSQSRGFSNELAGRGFACSWCACHEDVWGPSGHHAQNRGSPFTWSSDWDEAQLTDS